MSNIQCWFRERFHLLKKLSFKPKHIFQFKYEIPIKMNSLKFREHQFQKMKPDKTVKLILDGYLRAPFKKNATESKTPWVICCYLVSLSPSTVVMLNDSQRWVLPRRPRGQLAALLYAILMNNIYCQANAWKTHKTDDVGGKTIFILLKSVLTLRDGHAQNINTTESQHCHSFRLFESSLSESASLGLKSFTEDSLLDSDARTRRELWAGKVYRVRPVSLVVTPLN